jgi:hypothetical protein
MKQNCNFYPFLNFNSISYKQKIGTFMNSFLFWNIII